MTSVSHAVTCPHKPDRYCVRPAFVIARAMNPFHFTRSSVTGGGGNRLETDMLRPSNPLAAHWPLLLLTFARCVDRSSQANECLPQLADTCFKKLSSSLNCRVTYPCDDPVTLCELLDDSLQCSADIIDSDCSVMDGKDKFDTWYNGLRAVYSYLCHPMTNNNGTRESALRNIKSSMCWNKKIFIECVGEMLNIHHVVDMLNTSYDYKECIRMVIAMTNCNVNSQSTDCAEFQGLVNDLVFIFFSQQKCTDFRMDVNGVPFPISPDYVPMSIVPTIMLLNLFK